MKWLWQLHREWSFRARQARHEVARSQENLERTREQVVTPLVEWRERNHFA